MTATKVSVRAFAKVNLDLRVLGRRPDGYHELRTVFQSIALHDTLVFTSRRGPFAIRCRADGMPRDSTNLIWRAAAALARAACRDREPRDVAVTVDKQVPMQAGLGGGSADAAATLLALARLWRCEVTLDDLRTVARQLGADVPFFLTGGTALGLGRGDEVYPLRDVPTRWMLLLVPAVGVATPDAYARLDELRHRAGLPGQPDPVAVPALWSEAIPALTNDLEEPVARLQPDITVMKAALRARGASAALMSGSGSVVFGLFPSRSRAASAARALGRGAWRVLLTRTMAAAEIEARGRPRWVRG